MHQQQFSAVFCCSGQFQHPSVPQFAGRERYAGRVLHSRDYREPSALKGSRVLVVGVGNSALDVALEASRAGAAVEVAARTGTIAIPVASSAGKPMDGVLCNRAFQQTLPKLGQRAFFAYLVRSLNAAFAAAGMPQVPSDISPQHQRFSNVKEHAEWIRLLQSGDIRFRPGVSALTEHGAAFDDGSSGEYETIICCTGYQLKFPVAAALLAPVTERYRVGDSAVEAMALHRRIMHPEHPTLCFMGFVTCFGNEAAVGELQARWAVSELCGRSRSALPGPAALRRERDLTRAQLRARRPLFPRFVTYIPYCDALADDIGCTPPSSSLALWLEDPRLAYALWASPHVMAAYRLQGADRWAGARDFLVGAGAKL